MEPPAEPRVAGHDDETVDELVDRVVAGEPVRAADGLARTATELASLASEPIPADVRGRHLAAIHTTPPADPVGRFPRVRQRVRLAAAGLAATLTLAGGGAVAVAGDAAPGDLLYGLDRAVERVRLAVADGPDEAALRLAFAEERLAEASAAPDHADALVDEAVAGATRAAEANGANAVETLAGLLDDGPANATAQAAVATACVRIAERHGHDVPPACASLAADAAEDGAGTASGRSTDPSDRGRADEAPGRSDGVGPATEPETGDAGEPDGGESTGRPEDPGRPDDAGTAGRADDPGRPDDTGGERGDRD